MIENHLTIQEIINDSMIINQYIEQNNTWKYNTNILTIIYCLKHKFFLQIFLNDY